jgi:type III secretion protein N (ATPase)
MKSFDYVADMMQLALEDTPTLAIKGRVVQVIGTIIKAVVPAVKIGEVCILRQPGENFEMKAEVVGFARDAALLTPIGDMYGISASTEVIPTGRVHMVPVGDGLLGRVLDGLGQPLDEDVHGPLVADRFYPVFADAPDPMKRRIIKDPLPLGVRAIDSLLTCGEGQRMGIFAAAGGGKSTLLGMLVKGAKVDVTVIALIGERGREVREFLEHELGTEGRKRSVVVCATSDKSSMERTKAAYVATAIAEYFRDQGKKVLFLMDSVTRFARAQREIGLAAGEPPTRRGYPPSVFATLPKLMERVGMNDKVDPGRPHHPVTSARFIQPLPGDRRAGVDQPRAEQCGAARTPGRGWPDARADGQIRRCRPAGQDRRIPARRRQDHRRGDRQDRFDSHFPETAHRPVD